LLLLLSVVVADVVVGVCYCRCLMSLSVVVFVGGCLLLLLSVVVC
jgi:hypothetical protein